MTFSAIDARVVRLRFRIRQSAPDIFGRVKRLNLAGFLVDCTLQVVVGCLEKQYGTVD